MDTFFLNLSLLMAGALIGVAVYRYMTPHTPDPDLKLLAANARLCDALWTACGAIARYRWPGNDARQYEDQKQLFNDYTEKPPARTVPEEIK